MYLDSDGSGIYVACEPSLEGDEYLFDEYLFNASKLAIKYDSDVYREMLRFGIDTNFMYQTIEKDGVALNAMSYLNTVGAFYKIKCVGITDAYILDALSEEEQQKMQLFDEITKELLQSIPIMAVFSDVEKGSRRVNSVDIQTDVYTPTFGQGLNLVLTLDGAYIKAIREK